MPLMRLRSFAIATAITAGAATSGNAFAPHKGSDRPLVTNGRAPRAHRAIAWTAPKSAQTLPGWHGIWDHDTDVPVRLWGPSIAFAGSTADAKIAEAAARQLLAQQLATLAPGASVADFALAANALDPSGTIRTVTFAQSWRGIPVVDGAVGFTFERDHLVMLSSSAMRDVAAKQPGGTLARVDVETSAQHWLFQAGVQSTGIRSHGARVVFPLVRARTAHGYDIEYRVAETVSVESHGEAGRWDVYVDAIDGTPIARRQTLAFATGTVNFDVPDQSPSQTRSPHPAPNDTHTVNGAAITSDGNGLVTWTTASPATVAPGLTGPLIAMTNVAGALVTGNVSLANGGAVTWSFAATPESDAQLDSFVYASHAKAFAKAMYNPTLAYFDQQLSVNVNENMTCNAYSTGDDIHFFQGDTMCENTGRIADVVYHEFGHSIHYNSIIQGEGVFDASLSEGMADTNAITNTGNPNLGIGFFYNDMPLRSEGGPAVKVWPADADGEPHDEGEIIAEALWDTRQALQTKLGTEAGYLQFIKVYYSVVQRSPDIPSSLPPALVGDDDDGNLANGTPNMCEIQAAFAKHGLADPSVTLGLNPPTTDGSTVKLTITLPTDNACPTATVNGATITWEPHGGTPADLVMGMDDAQDWSAAIPTQPDNTVVDYHVTVTLSDGSTITYPQNPADTQYQMYFGAVTPIKCFDFEDGGPGWTHTGAPAANDEWQVGPPLGVGGDPSSAHGGTNVLGIDLGASSSDGLYDASTMQSVTSPEIDLGAQTNVRLQYYRWLNVEDGIYDQGTISANGTAVWSNFASATMGATEINHTDKEWRFADVDLTTVAATAGGKLTLKFELDSDPGLELGGWTIDDLCVVAYGANVGAVCGNGVVDPGEQCDDGNTTSGDGCSSTCQFENGSDMEGKTGGGCCSASRDPSGAIVLSVLTVGVILRRRKRR